MKKGVRGVGRVPKKYRDFSVAHHESIAKKNVWKSVKDKYVKNRLPKVTVY